MMSLVIILRGKPHQKMKQIVAAQENLTNIKETEVHDALQNTCKKQQSSTKNKTR